MLQPIGKDIWHVPHHFTSMGLRLFSRMTVVRLGSGKLWLHSPVPISPQLRAQLAELGEVAFIVAPNRFHHLFAGTCRDAFPHAALYGAPGLAAKRPDLQDMRELRGEAEAEWAHDLGQVFVEGIPALNENVWFHHASRSLIVTDLCQWWTGSMPVSGRVYASLTGIRKRPGVPLTVRLVIKDRAALARSVRRILQWEFERVVLAHNTVIEHAAYDAVKQAFEAAHAC
jgi:hypothetical protein